MRVVAFLGSALRASQIPRNLTIALDDKREEFCVQRHT